jgi:hypothetical protein
VKAGKVIMCLKLRADRMFRSWVNHVIPTLGRPLMVYWHVSKVPTSRHAITKDRFWP